MTVDEYVQAKIRPEYHEIAIAIRDLMQDCAPSSISYIAYGMPVWKTKKIFAFLVPNKNELTLSFTHGADFNDQYGLLKGKAKSARHVKFKDLQDVRINEAALRAYIQQALDIDAK